MGAPSFRAVCERVGAATLSPVVILTDDIEGFNAFANSPSYLNVIQPDEERFTDPKRCEYFFSEEHSIIK